MDPSQVKVVFIEVPDFKLNEHIRSMWLTMNDKWYIYISIAIHEEIYGESNDRANNRKSGK